jgi:hypothetical protein
MIRMLIDGMDLLAVTYEAVSLSSNDPEADETILALRAAMEMWQERPSDHASAVAEFGELTRRSEPCTMLVGISVSLN